MSACVYIYVYMYKYKYKCMIAGRKYNKTVTVSGEFTYKGLFSFSIHIFT